MQDAYQRCVPCQIIQQVSLLLLWAVETPPSALLSPFSVLSNVVHRLQKRYMYVIEKSADHSDDPSNLMELSLFMAEMFYRVRIGPEVKPLPLSFLFPPLSLSVICLSLSYSLLSLFPSLSRCYMSLSLFSVFPSLGCLSFILVLSLSFFSSLPLPPSPPSFSFPFLSLPPSPFSISFFLPLFLLLIFCYVKKWQKPEPVLVLAAALLELIFILLELQQDQTIICVCNILKVRKCMQHRGCMSSWSVLLVMGCCISAFCMGCCLMPKLYLAQVVLV